MKLSEALNSDDREIVQLYCDILVTSKKKFYKMRNFLKFRRKYECTWQNGKVIIHVKYRIK